MNTKIQELTENIYNEGVAKARQEAELILKQARTEAEKTIADAKEKASLLTLEAAQQAEQIDASVKAELQAISEQIIEITRQKITNLITARTSENIADRLTSDESLIKEMIMEITRHWLTLNGHGQQLDTLVSENMANKIKPAFLTEATEIMQGKVNIKPVSGLKQGFQIVNQAEAFKISFTNDDFQQFFSSLMKPAMRNFLFNNENE